MEAYVHGMAHDMYTANGPTLTPELMLRAYAAGIFPMSEGAQDPSVFWVDPQRRGVFPLDSFHTSKSLRKTINRGGFEIRINSDFTGVVAGCADRDLTWINDDLWNCYMALHADGAAHSVEVWDDKGLAGGVFGVALGGAFFGESMFSKRTNASKLALAHLVQRLAIGGFTLFDTQFVTDHLESLGAIEIPRATYRKELGLALMVHANFYTMPLNMVSVR
jgi:leucyl/phenylalanyl-tRNA--protein transferase